MAERVPASGFTVWFDTNNTEHHEDPDTFEVKGNLLTVTAGASVTYYPGHSWLKVVDHRGAR